MLLSNLNAYRAVRLIAKAESVLQGPLVAGRARWAAAAQVPALAVIPAHRHHGATPHIFHSATLRSRKTCRRALLHRINHNQNLQMHAAIEEWDQRNKPETYTTLTASGQGGKISKRWYPLSVYLGVVGTYTVARSRVLTPASSFSHLVHRNNSRFHRGRHFRDEPLRTSWTRCSRLATGHLAGCRSTTDTAGQERCARIGGGWRAPQQKVFPGIGFRMRTMLSPGATLLLPGTARSLSTCTHREACREDAPQPCGLRTHLQDARQLPDSRNSATKLVTAQDQLLQVRRGAHCIGANRRGKSCAKVASRKKPDRTRAEVARGGPHPEGSPDAGLSGLLPSAQQHHWFRQAKGAALQGALCRAAALTCRPSGSSHSAGILPIKRLPLKPRTCRVGELQATFAPIGKHWLRQAQGPSEPELEWELKLPNMRRYLDLDLNASCTEPRGCIGFAWQCLQARSTHKRRRCTPSQCSLTCRPSGSRQHAGIEPLSQLSCKTRYCTVENGRVMLVAIGKRCVKPKPREE